MRTGHARLRALALMTAGAIGVHELRYVIGYDGHAGTALASQGHGYLSAVSLGAALLVGLALAAFAAALLRARSGRLEAPRAPHSLVRLWLAATLGLAAIYVAQETLEGLLASGHPAGLEGLVGQGGWVAFALAAGAGLGVALGLRGADTAVALAARAAGRRRPRRTGRPAVGRVRVPLRRLVPLATHLAGRAPPLTS